MRSDTLGALTTAGQQTLVDYGIRTIVDLRLPVELEIDPNPFSGSEAKGVVYRHCSLVDPGINERLNPVVDLAKHYRSLLQQCAHSIAIVLATIAESDDGGVLIHCHGGQDRTGIISALLLNLVGVYRETIIADYVLTAEFLRAQNESFLEHGSGDRADREAEIALFSPRAEVMRDTLAFVDATYGGAIGYLHWSGLDDVQITRLKSRLI